jgi:hypothetical protein
LGPRARAALGAAVLSLAVALPFTGATADERPDALVYDTPGSIPALSPESRRTQRHQVVIADHGLTPNTAVIWQGEEVGWLSMSRSASRIVFEREVARSLVCHSLVNFYLAEDELRSGDLFSGDRASFCELAPGRYRYRVVRSGHGDAQGLAGARRLDGWIIVKPRSVAATGR